jgi:hypothetical protein
MKENIDIWGVFHDGSIVEIQGTLPNIAIRIEMEYLRNIFPCKGNSFWANINGCQWIEFLNWKSEIRTSNLKEIEEEELEILNVQQTGEEAQIITSSGELKMLYGNLTFKLDTNISLSYQELKVASSKYWNEGDNRPKNS